MKIPTKTNCASKQEQTIGIKKQKSTNKTTFNNRITILTNIKKSIKQNLKIKFKNQIIRSKRNESNKLTNNIKRKCQLFSIFDCLLDYLFHLFVWNIVFKCTF